MNAIAMAMHYMREEYPFGEEPYGEEHKDAVSLVAEIAALEAVADLMHQALATYDNDGYYHYIDENLVTQAKIAAESIIPTTPNPHQSKEDE